MTIPRSETPPHLPTYNVRLSQEKIEAICACIFPSSELVSCHQLESGKSYNNRIYFIKVRRDAVDARIDDLREDFVLKVSGHYFEANKIQNEVGSLLLLQRFCPSVPVPRVIAWSQDGKNIECVDGRTYVGNGRPLNDLSNDSSNIASDHGWILTSSLPGRVLNDEDLNGKHGPNLLKQIATHLAAWRSQIPDGPQIGNIRFREPRDQAVIRSDIDLSKVIGVNHSFELTIGGNLLCHQYCASSLPTPLAYYLYLVNDQLYHLQNYPRLESLRRRIAIDVQQFIDDMPRLSFFRSSDDETHTSRFTHCDFAPRNILVSDTKSLGGIGPPQITGILDMEFAAFLPYEDEFINMQVRQSDDWTAEQYKTLVYEFARGGCQVPHIRGQYGEPVCTKASEGQCSCDSRTFEGLCLLAKVTGSIAPWFIQGESSHTDEELEVQVNIAANEVLSGIARLRRFLINP